MNFDQLSSPGSADVGAWVKSAVIGSLGTVGGCVPSGFHAYARIFHPAIAPDGGVITWAKVAATTGRKAHALMQWHAIIGSSEPDCPSSSLWSGENPERGSLPVEVLRSLCDTLEQHTSDSNHCLFGLWTGKNLAAFAFAEAADALTHSSVQETQKAAFSMEELEGPQFRLKGRQYVLLEGPLTAAKECNSGGELLENLSPNLLWPSDKAWFVATDIDLDSTLVAGSDELITAVVSSPELEAWPIGHLDSLAFDGDLVNAVADGGR